MRAERRRRRRERYLRARALFIREVKQLFGLLIQRRRRRLLPPAPVVELLIVISSTDSEEDVPPVAAAAQRMEVVDLSVSDEELLDLDLRHVKRRCNRPL